MSFVKIYGDRLLRSSLWIKENAVTRVLWITMLSLADARGFVAGPLIGLLDAAKLTREECERALERLAAPDPDSRNPRSQGRRVRAMKGGWKIINYTKYRDMRTEGQVREASRKQRWRKSNSDNAPQRDMSRVSQGLSTEVEVDVEVDKEKTTTPVAAKYDQVFEEAWSAYPKRPNNNKQAAWRQWLARVAESVEPLDMLEGTRRYAKYVERETVEPRFVKLASTFYGRDRHFASDYASADAFAHLPGYPHVVKDGWLTEYGERVTRPAGSPPMFS